jgi:hypothetical protein
LHMNVYQLCVNNTIAKESDMEKREKIVLEVALLLALCILTIGVFGTAMSVLQANRTFSNAGSVKGVGVGIYGDSACTNQISSISWGVLDPGSSRTFGVYVRNEGNAPVVLTKTVQNWNPANLQSYVTLNWNYSNQTLSPNQVLPLSVTLVVSSTVTGITSFSFDVTITATG